ncbi:hypothetical protein TCAL_13196 [Tigriopus californicus]|uniref:Chitin-binding type-2 domain-containing protein n=1 Tax=Tigriopus californicus TaxID=6832 RepID=A0A553PMM9_TIGCA|nr:hypothetical protein TCAL_13196 [Tigriopus californicus]|eukprot:TCALIF_13196-PA protein Name:"Protein of unknown function" AED:0.15 eAED:0.15 QI:52/0.66/0.5/0.75/1/1/4/0/165
MISLALILVCATLTCGQEEEVDHDHAHHSGNPLDWLRDSVPGEPGVDYPIFNEVQDTAFSCEDRVFGGYYADPGMGCQGYHVCLNHGNNARKLSFLCPNGTIFQQSKLTCEWWFNVDCTEAQSSYNVNDLIGTGDSLPESNDLGPKRPIPTRNNDNVNPNRRSRK